MDLVTFKIISFIAIFAVGRVGGFIATRIEYSENSKRFFSLGTAFAGGIFLGAGLIHMLPDARKGFEGIAGAGDFPWVSLICAAGFLLILFLEKVLLHGHDAIADSAASEDEATLYPYVLTLVLSVHSIIAGIALGTEETFSQTLIIFVAVLAHKGSASFALAVSLFRGNIPKKRVMKIIAFFSCMTPLGILIGSVMTEMMTGKSEQIVTAVFDALAAGTFLYVAILGIIDKEFSERQDKLFKFILLAFGLGIMAMIAVWV